MLAVLEQTHAEQSVVIEVEGLRHAWLLRLDVGDLLHLQAERLAVVYRLLRVTLLVQFYMREQRGMRCYGTLDGSLQLLLVNTVSELIQIGNLITYLALMSGTIGIDAILGFC